MSRISKGDYEIRNALMIEARENGITLKDIGEMFSISKQMVQKAIGKIKRQTMEHPRGGSAPKDIRFLRKITITDYCWEWQGSKRSIGYGAFYDIESGHYAHRYSYRYFNGEIPDGLIVMHKCDNPSCVNPAHLVLGTPADNIADRDAKGRNGGQHMPPKGKTGYKGVSIAVDKRNKRFRATIKGRLIGSYPTVEEAAMAYDTEAKAVYSDPILNFPEHQ